VQKGVVYFYKHVTDGANWVLDASKVSEAVMQNQIDRNPKLLLDYYDDRIYFTKEFEELEKRNRKQYTDPKYHKAIDSLDLTMLKQNLIDPVSGRCFTPRGWQ